MLRAFGNSAVLFSWLCLQTAPLPAQTQLGAQAKEPVRATLQPDESVGWQISSEDGKFELVLRLDPHSYFPDGDSPAVVKLFRIPEQLRGHIDKVVVRTAVAPAPRNPTLNELAERPKRSFRVDEEFAPISDKSSSTDQYSWIQDKRDGAWQYIVRVPHTHLRIMAKHEKEMVSQVPPMISSKLKEVAVVTGAQPPELFQVARDEDEATSRPLDSVDVLKARCLELDQQAAKLALQLKQSAPGSKEQQLELRRAVREAFEARQELLRAQIVELQKRTNALQHKMDAQEKMSEKIIDQKLEVLLKSK